jgi:DNA-binding response OmpR family regulator
MSEIRKTFRILVVDDDPSVIRLLAGLLKTSGFEALLADDAPSGLELAMKQKPDLIVLNVMMPIINGFNICRLMKSEAACKHIPIILLTSRVTEEDRRIGQEVGADAYMLKPLNTAEFLHKVEELLHID